MLRLFWLLLLSLPFPNPAYPQALGIQDGQYVGTSSAGAPVLVVVRSGRVVSARFEPRVSGCDSSDPSWDCSRVAREIRVVGHCSILWTVPWEEGYVFSAKLDNAACRP